MDWPFRAIPWMTAAGLVAVLVCPARLRSEPPSAGRLDVSIETADRVDWIGIVRRFDADGNLVRKPDPKEKFDAPYCDARSQGNTAHFAGLTPGLYDVRVFLKDGTRLEGFHWSPFQEFDDPDDPAFKKPPPKEIEQSLRKRIAASRHYENKVTPLAFAGDKQHVRVLMQLLRDKPTSFDRMFGQPVATLRYELWQYTNHFGGWTRDNRRHVLHRLIVAKSQLRKRRCLWVRDLGGLRVKRSGPASQLSYRLPKSLSRLPGLKPY